MTNYCCRLFLLFVIGGILAGCTGGNISTGSGTEPDADSSVVATFAGETITMDEFETAYAESHSQPVSSSDSLSAHKTFLEQYVNYRLKVKAAREAGLDTLSSVRKEMRSYRNKLARPRLMRSEVYEPLTRTLYQRRQEEVDVSHILIRVSQNASPEDTLEAYREIQSIADSLQRGQSFGELASRNSDDPSAQKQGERGFKGRLGYIRAGQIVEPFEKRMYNLEPDSVSDVFRSQYGYHLLKVHDRRPAVPPIRLSHIMIGSENGDSSPTALLDSLRTELIRGNATFSELAQQYSDDRRSAPKGGDLGQVESIQSLPPSFQNVVTELDSVGAISEVVESQYGHHLIQLTDREEHPSYEEAYEDLKETLSGRPRVERQREAFARSIRREMEVDVDTTRLLQEVNAASLDTLSRALLPVADPQASTPRIALLGDSTYTLGQLAQHVMQTDGGARMTLGTALDDFLNEKAFLYAQAQLEEHDPEFASRMKDYREGLLVFQFMQDSVWTAAAQDTAGLRKTFQERRDQYRFPERVRSITLRAPSDTLLTPYRSAYADTSTLPRLVKRATADSLVRVDTTMVTEASAEVYQQLWSVQNGATVGPTAHDGDSLFMIRDTLLSARHKTFEEARSSVIRDYQDLYEDEVLSRLRRRYHVETFPERLNQAFGNQSQEKNSQSTSDASPAEGG